MRTTISKIYMFAFLLVAGTLILLSCNEDDKIYPETRLFRPVLNEDLKAEGNSIIVDMAEMIKAQSFTIEVSRDSFQTVDYTIETDTNYVVINETLPEVAGDPLFWSMLYQVRATAHASDPAFDSKVAYFGSVRTEQFPTILITPSAYDVTDVTARITWSTEGTGAAVTAIKVFAGSDLKLQNVLLQEEVTSEENDAGEAFVSGLSPSTQYQIAIYSGDELRGWVQYNTLVADFDPATPGVIDLREATDPTAVATAVATAASGSTILLKRGSKFNLPNVALNNKSITIRAAYGFGPKKAMLVNTNGNWNIATGSNIEYIRFVGLELRGNGFGSTYVFNPDVSNISVGEILFEDCTINTMRAIMRMRNSNAVVDNFKIINCLVDSIGDFGIFNADTDPNGSPSSTARVNNILLENSTFNHIRTGISSRNNSIMITIESCTFSNTVDAEAGVYLFRYRGGTGNNNVTGGITIRNSIFGPGWNRTGTPTNNIRGKEGLPSTPVEIVNTHATNDWTFITTYEIAGFPSSVYAGNQNALWVSPGTGDFNFKDDNFTGRFSAGDPRWRVKI